MKLSYSRPRLDPRRAVHMARVGNACAVGDPGSDIHLGPRPLERERNAIHRDRRPMYRTAATFVPERSQQYSAGWGRVPARWDHSLIGGSTPPTKGGAWPGGPAPATIGLRMLAQAERAELTAQRGIGETAVEAADQRDRDGSESERFHDRFDPILCSIIRPVGYGFPPAPCGRGTGRL
jgi:hypothetical protein